MLLVSRGSLSLLKEGAREAGLRVEWMEKLERCATKCGRPLESMQVLAPEADFPSPDGKHPLKMVVAKVAE